MEDKPHILIVDDDRRLRELLRKYLADQGFWVSTATDAADVRPLEGLGEPLGGADEVVHRLLRFLDRTLVHDETKLDLFILFSGHVTLPLAS